MCISSLSKYFYRVLTQASQLKILQCRVKFINLSILNKFWFHSRLILIMWVQTTFSQFLVISIKQFKDKISFSTIYMILIKGKNDEV